MTIYLIVEEQNEDFEGTNQILGYATSLEAATSIAEGFRKILEDYDNWYSEQEKFAREKAGEYPKNPYGLGKYRPLKEELDTYQKESKAWNDKYAAGLREFEANNSAPEEPDFGNKPIVKVVEEIKWEEA